MLIPPLRAQMWYTNYTHVPVGVPVTPDGDPRRTFTDYSNSIQVTGPACTRRAIRGELLGQLQSTGRAVATVETCVAVATQMGRQHRA